MANCEWETKAAGPGEQVYCKREGTYACSLVGSNSAANLWFMCWQHRKKYRNKKFVEDTFGKGAKVSILKIGHHNPELVKPIRKTGHAKVRAEGPLVCPNCAVRAVRYSTIFKSYVCWNCTAKVKVNGGS